MAPNTPAAFDPAHSSAPGRTCPRANRPQSPRFPRTWWAWTRNSRRDVKIFVQWQSMREPIEVSLYCTLMDLAGFVERAREAIPTHKFFIFRGIQLHPSFALEQALVFYGVLQCCTVLHSATRRVAGLHCVAACCRRKPGPGATQCCNKRDLSSQQKRPIQSAAGAERRPISRSPTKTRETLCCTLCCMVQHCVATQCCSWC